MKSVSRCIALVTVLPWRSITSSGLNLPALRAEKVAGSMLARRKLSPSSDNIALWGTPAKGLSRFLLIAGFEFTRGVCEKGLTPETASRKSRTSSFEMRVFWRGVFFIAPALAVGVQKTFCVKRSHAACCGRGDCLPIDVIHYVTGGENTRHAGRSCIPVEPR